MREPETSRQSAVPLSGCILTVDDNQDAADSLAMLLQSLGAKTHVAYDGPSALKAIREHHPSAVLLDVGMPGMDGYEVAHRVRQDPATRGTVLIAVTGWNEEEDRRRSMEAGFDHHLVKPVDIDALRRCWTSGDCTDSGRHLGIPARRPIRVKRNFFDSR